MCWPGRAVTVAVNVSLTLHGLKAVVAATQALLREVQRVVTGLDPDDAQMPAFTVLSGALKQRSGTRSWRSVNVTGVGGTSGRWGRGGGGRRRRVVGWSWWSWWGGRGGRGGRLGVVVVVVVGAWWWWWWWWAGFVVVDVVVGGAVVGALWSVAPSACTRRATLAPTTPRQ